MLVICAVLISYMSSQKGEFTFLGSAQYNLCVPNSFSISVALIILTGLFLSLVADYLLIKCFGGLLVVKKPYLIQTLRLTL